MKILVACEESQAVCKEFRNLGHEAYSCDIVECSGGHPEWHIMGDALEIINPKEYETTVGTWFGGYTHETVKGIMFCTCDRKAHFIRGTWDMIIAFPPCTYLTVTGNSWFNIEKYGEKAIQRHKNREEAIKFFMAFANADCPRIAIENPVGVMSSKWRKPNQIINPYEFGDPFEKRTCLWLKGLPELMPTNIVEVPARKEYDSGRSMPAWYADAWKLPKNERAKLRSKTFPGIAHAMSTQWNF